MTIASNKKPLNSEIQLEKAEQKIILVKETIELLKRLNEIEDEENRKNYTIELSYAKINHYIKFSVNILRNNKPFFNDFNFKLDKIEVGNKIFIDLNWYFENNFDDDSCISYLQDSKRVLRTNNQYGNFEFRTYFYNEDEKTMLSNLNESFWDKKHNEAKVLTKQ